MALSGPLCRLPYMRGECEKWVKVNAQDLWVLIQGKKTITNFNLRMILVLVC